MPRPTVLLAAAMFSLTAAASGPTPRPVPAAAGSFRTYVDGRWGQVHVRVAGPADGPTVLLLHKMVWSSLEFERAQPLLAARGIRSIAVDLPGYGLSDAPPTQPSTDDYADDLVPVLDALHVRKATIVGVNTGATMAVAFALQHPDRTDRVIVDGLAIFHGAALRAALAEPAFDRSARPDAGAFVARWRELKAMAGPHYLSDEAVQRALLQFFQASPDYRFGHQAIFRYDLEAALTRVREPLLVITYPGDQLNAQALAAKRANPRFDLVTIGWTGMTADWQAAAPWAAAVANYVAPAAR